MKKRIISVAILLSLLLAMPVQASGDVSMNGHFTDISDSICKKVPQSEVAELERGIANSRQYVTRSTGRYEPNDSRQTAYPYAGTEKIACSPSPYGHYNCFYTPNSIETANDLDYFWINTGIGIEYIVALKNVWLDQIRDIRVYYQEDDGSWYYWYAKTKTDNQTFFHFTTTTNKYYIRISGGPASGYQHTSDANWFAMERDGTIDERPHVSDKNPPCALK